MRTFEFRRHSIKDGLTRDMVGPRGFALARAVGARQLRGRGFTHFFCSDYWRTHQTLAAFDEGAGDMSIKHVPLHAPFYAEVDGVDEMFRACAEAERRGDKILDAALTHDENLVHHYGYVMKDAFLAWNDALPNKARVLVVGHSPSMEILALTMNMRVASLKECQGFRVSVATLGRKAWRITSDLASADLDPSAIRAELKLDPGA